MADSGTTRPTSEWEKFRAATKHVLSVSKEELAKREKAWRQKRRKRKRS